MEHPDAKVAKQIPFACIGQLHPRLGHSTVRHIPGQQVADGGRIGPALLVGTEWEAEHLWVAGERVSCVAHRLDAGHG